MGTKQFEKMDKKKLIKRIVQYKKEFHEVEDKIVFGNTKISDLEKIIKRLKSAEENSEKVIENIKSNFDKHVSAVNAMNKILTERLKIYKAILSESTDYGIGLEAKINLTDENKDEGGFFGTLNNGKK